MNMFQLSFRERTIAVVFIIVCCVYVCWFFIYQPSVLELQRLSDATLVARKKFIEQSKVIAREKQAPEFLRKVLETKIQKSPDQEVVSGILSDVENAARSMNIRIIEMKPQAVVVDGEFNRFSVNLAVDGSLKELLAFIHFLQAPEYDLEIAQCFMERPFGEATTLQAKIVIVQSLIRLITGNKPSDK